MILISTFNPCTWFKTRMYYPSVASLKFTCITLSILNCIARVIKMTCSLCIWKFSIPRSDNGTRTIRIIFRCPNYINKKNGIQKHFKQNSHGGWINLLLFANVQPWVPTWAIYFIASVCAIPNFCIASPFNRYTIISRNVLIYPIGTFELPVVTDSFWLIIIMNTLNTLISCQLVRFHKRCV